MPITITVSDNRFPRIAAALPGATSQVVRKTTFDIQSGIQTNIHAQGLIDTGNYLNGWQVEIEQFEGVIYNNAAYGPRLEFGFVGADSRGRVYNQAPRPHVMPAVEAARPGFIEALSHLERLL